MVSKIWTSTVDNVVTHLQTLLTSLDCCNISSDTTSDNDEVLLLYFLLVLAARAASQLY